MLMEKIKERGMRCGIAPLPGASILSLGFDNLATIVDGKTGDDTSLKPFTKHFTEEKILKAWAKVGFVPFTRHCITDKKVRHELGQWNVNNDLEVLHDKYANLVATAEDLGLNKGVFTAAIPVAYRLERVVDEDEQVRQLLLQKGAFSAGALWSVCGTRVGNARVVLRAQREQIALDEAKTASVTQNRLGRQAKLLANEQMALHKFKTDGRNALNDKDWGNIVRWVLPEAKVAGLMRDLKKNDAIIAKLATLERDWQTYIPPSTPV